MTEPATAANRTTPIDTTQRNRIATADPAADLVQQATNLKTGTVDTKQLAGLVADAARADPAKASASYAAIEQQLSRSSVGDAGRFAADVRGAVAANNNDRSNLVPGPSITGAAFGAVNGGRTALTSGNALSAAGTQRLIDNPILKIQWENTVSAWTNKSGFTGPLREALGKAGISINPTNLVAPPGSVRPSSGIDQGRAANINGAAAEQAIATRMQGQGYQTTTAPAATNRVQNGSRVVDVIASKPNADPRMSERVEIESKVGKTSHSGSVTTPKTPQYELAKDAERLTQNGIARNSGFKMEVDGATLAKGGKALEVVGKVARPIGLAFDVAEVAGAIHADGGRIGENTGRAASGIAGSAAGGYGGAVAGAALGTLIFPGVGTVVGGVVGGVLGSIGGDAAGRGVFDTVKSWF